MRRHLARVLVWVSWRLCAMAQRVDITAAHRAARERPAWWYANPEHLKLEPK